MPVRSRGNLNGFHPTCEMPAGLSSTNDWQVVGFGRFGGSSKTPSRRFRVRHHPETSPRLPPSYCRCNPMQIPTTGPTVTHMKVMTRNPPIDGQQSTRFIVHNDIPI